MLVLSSWKAQGISAEPKAVSVSLGCATDLNETLNMTYHIVNESLWKHIIWLNYCLLIHIFSERLDLRVHENYYLGISPVRVLGNKDTDLLFCSLASFPRMKWMYTDMLQAGIYSKILANTFRNIFIYFHDYLHPTIWPVLQFFKLNKLCKNYHNHIIFLGQWHWYFRKWG